MERIASDRGHVYALGGFVYTLNRVYSGTSYFSCARNHCSSRVAVTENQVPVVSPHNHEADEVDVEVFHFRNELRRLSTDNRLLDARTIFNLASERFPHAAVRVGFPNVRNTIYRHRARGVPPIPNNLAGMHQALTSDQWRHWNECLADEERQPFFRAVVGGEQAGWTAGMYFSTRLAAALTDTERLHIDATFKTVPANLQAYQLLTIHAEHMGHLFPVVFVLMTKRTQVAYEGVFEWVRNAIPNLAPRVILTDFEAAMRNAAHITWRPRNPEIQLQMIGCWFHFAQAVYGMHVRLGMRPLTDTNVEAGWALHMLIALALLPAQRISVGLDVVRHYVSMYNVSNEFRALFGYMDNYWVRTVGVDNFSVYRQPHRTNNALEGFYSTLLGSMGPHPGVWHFHDHLRRVELSNWQDLQRVQNNVPHVRPRRRIHRQQDMNITRAQDQLDTGVFNEAQFLHRLAHCARSLTGRTLRDRTAPVVPDPGRLPAVPMMPPHYAPAHGPALPPGPAPPPVPAPAHVEAPARGRGRGRGHARGRGQGRGRVQARDRGQARGRGQVPALAPAPAPAPHPATTPAPAQAALPAQAPVHAPAPPLAPVPFPAPEPVLAPAPFPAPAPVPPPALALVEARQPGDCTVCLGEPATCVAIPCGHCCVCVSCADTLRERLEDNRCPFCRAPIIGLFLLYRNL